MTEGTEARAGATKGAAAAADIDQWRGADFSDLMINKRAGSRLCRDPELRKAGGETMIDISQVTRRFAYAGVLLLGLSLAGGALADEVTIYRSTAPFDEVRQDLADAIVNRGYVIDYEAHIGEMLARTAADVGSSQALFAEGRANSMQFCSAVLSRKTMEADVMNIAYCPYVLFVFQARSDDPTVTIGFRRLPERGSEDSKAALATINKLLDEIAREAAEQ